MCNCGLCYLREYGWYKWYARYRSVWRFELNGSRDYAPVPVEILKNLDYVWMNNKSKCPYSFSELEIEYLREK